MSELKSAFIRTLNLDDEHTIVPENSHLFAAIGSALNYKDNSVTTLSSLIDRLSNGIKMEFEVARMEPLFKDQADYDEFTTRHGNNHVKTGDLSTYKGNCYLGIDAGSTTTKIALISEDGDLYTHSTATTTEALSLQPSVLSRRFTQSFLRMHTSYTPALQATERLY